MMSRRENANDTAPNDPPREPKHRRPRTDGSDATGRDDTLSRRRRPHPDRDAALADSTLPRVLEPPPSGPGSTTRPGLTTRIRWLLVPLTGVLVLWILVVILRPLPPPHPSQLGPPCPFGGLPVARPLPAGELIRRLEWAEGWWTRTQQRLASAPLTATERAIQTHVDAAFEPIHARIPGFLDWHYSVVGQYTELGLAAVSGLRQQLEALGDEAAQEATPPTRLRDRVAEGLQQQLTPRLDALGERLQQEATPQFVGDLPERAEEAFAAVERTLRGEVRALIAQWKRDAVEATTAARARDIGFAPPATLSRPVSASARTGSAADAPCAGMHRRRATGPRTQVDYADMLDLAIPGTFRRFTATAGTTIILVPAAVRATVGALRAAVARMLARAAARTAGGAAVRAAARGLAGGLLGPLVAALAWLVIDNIAVRVDEKLHRDDLERELGAAIDEKKAELTMQISRAVAVTRMELSGSSSNSTPIPPRTPNEIPPRASRP